MASSNYISDCLSRRVIFFTGKGGVGKSTLAWATAVACRRQGRKVSFISWNPFEDESRRPAGSDPSLIPWFRLSGRECFHEYAIQILKFERLYRVLFDNAVIRAFIEVAPGLAESVIAGKIWDLYSHHPDTLYIVDLPASGHAISFFQSPLGLHKLFPKGIVHRETGAIRDLFASSETRVDLVTLAEELPVTEAKELHSRLAALEVLKFGYIHLNQCLPPELDREFSSTSDLGNRQGEWRRTEKENIAALSSLALPQIKTPRMTNDLFSEVVEAAAASLERA